MAEVITPADPDLAAQLRVGDRTAIQTVVETYLAQIRVIGAAARSLFRVHGEDPKVLERLPRDGPQPPLDQANVKRRCTVGQPTPRRPTARVHSPSVARARRHTPPPPPLRV